MPTLNDVNQFSNLDKMSWIQLRTLREQYQNDRWMQELIAPFEHRAYARESVAGNPLKAMLFGGALVPGYQAYKTIFSGGAVNPGDPSQTPASLDQLFAGLQGTYEGLRK